MAYQQADANKISHFQYLYSLYMLAFDVLLFNVRFQPLQQWGLCIMVGSYVLLILSALWKSFC